jgi:hypothetical protein
MDHVEERAEPREGARSRLAHRAVRTVEGDPHPGKRVRREQRNEVVDVGSDSAVARVMRPPSPASHRAT